MYFVSFPLFIDSTAIFLLKHSDFLSKLLGERYIGNARNIEFNAFVNAAACAFSINAAYYLCQRLYDFSFPPLKELGASFSVRRLYIAAFVGMLALVVFVYFNKLAWFHPSFFVEQSGFAYYASFLLCIFAGLAIPSLSKKKIYLAIIFIFPPIIVSLGTSERPWAIAAITVPILYFLYKENSGMPKIRLGMAVLFGLIGVVFLRMVRHGVNYNGGSLLSFFTNRDPSYFSMLFVFNTPAKFDAITGGKASAFALLSGVLKIFRDTLGYSYNAVNIPLFVAKAQMGWSAGSMHPTLYGWAFADLGYMSFLVGVFFALTSTFFFRAIWKIKNNGVIFLIPAMGMADALIARGTVQRGWAQLIFMFSLIFLISAVGNLLRPLNRKHVSIAGEGN